MACKHNTCKRIRNLGGRGGVAGAILTHYNASIWTILLGKERDGVYKGTSNLCAGKLEKVDNGCYLKAFVRELKEEFKINLLHKDGTINWKLFNKFFLNSQGMTRFIMHNKTPVFIGVFPGLSRKPLNACVDWCLQNEKSLSWSECEMSKVDWFKLSDQQQLEGEFEPISSFARAVMKRIVLSKL